MGEAGRLMRAKAMTAILLLAGAAMCGCADEPPAGQAFTYNGNSWQILDSRDTGTLTVVAVDPRLAGLGTQAAILHPIDPMPEAEYRAAVNGWFATTGRFCTPGTPEQADPGYQYSYSCWTPP